MQITKNVIALRNYIVYSYLLIDGSNLVLIDTGLPGNAPSILKEIKSLGYQPSDLKMILLTHSDGDHTGSAAKLRELTGAKIFASKPESDAIAKGVASRELKATGIARLFYNTIGRLLKVQPLEVDKIIASGSCLPVLGGLEVVDSKGHTPGHISYSCRSQGMLFAGDSIQIKKHKSLPSSGANTWHQELADKSYQSQMDLRPRWILAGHGLLEVES